MTLHPVHNSERCFNDQPISQLTLVSIPRRFRGIYITVRTLSCIHLAFSLPFRLAFVPDFSVSNWNDICKYFGIALPDFISTTFFTIELGRYVLGSYYKFRRRREIFPDTVIKCNNNNKPPSNRATLVRMGPLDIKDDYDDSFCKAERKNIWKDWFLWMSIIATIPLEYIFIPFAINPNYLLLNRSLRVLFLPSYLNDVVRILEEKNLIKNISLHRTWMLFFAMSMAGHWCGCVFFIVAKQVARESGELTWPEARGLFGLVGKGHEIEILRSIPDTYIEALYWAYITMITTGFGDIVPLSIQETVWCIIAMYLGVFITTCAIANLQMLMTNMDAAQTDFQNKIERIKAYMRHRQLPQTLQDRILSFYDYQWDLLKGANEGEFISELPRSLQQKISNYMCRDLISTLPILRGANNALLNALVDCIENNIYSPNDEIMQSGEQLRGVIIVSRGEVEILKGNSVQKTLKRSDRFAEESLFERVISEFTVRSKTFCEIFTLPSSEFQRIVESQCDKDHVTQMKEIAQTTVKNLSKASKLFGFGQAAIDIRGLKKHFQPHSTFRKLWDSIMFIGVIFYVFAIGINVMYCAQSRTYMDDFYLLSLSYFVDLMFVINTLLNFSQFMYMEEGLMVCDKERIKEHYKRQNYIPVEIVAMIPVDLVALLIGQQYLNLLRLTKILHLPKLLRFFDRVERLLSETRYNISQSARRVVKLNLLMISFCHWVGCFWYMSADLGSNIGLSSNWRVADEEDSTLAIDHSDLGGGSGYLRSYYWAIVGMSTVGYGDIVPTNSLETTIATFIILFGGLVLPAVVGGLAAYMSSLNQSSEGQKKKLVKIQRFMKKKAMGQITVDKVVHYYDYIWSQQGGVDEQEIMEELPAPLRQRVAMCVNGKYINSIPFFSFCDKGIQEHLVSVLIPRVFLPNDVIVSHGEVGKEMFLIEQGTAVVCSADKSVTYCLLTKGAYFGETSLLGDHTLRIATVNAKTYCDCFILTKDGFNEVMGAYPPTIRQEIINAVNNTIRKKAKCNGRIRKNFKCNRKCLRIVGPSSWGIKNEEEKLLPMARLRPDSPIRHIWSGIILLVCVYNAWVIPFRIAFNFSGMLHVSDWIVDFIFVADIYLHLYEFSYLHKGLLVSDKNEIKKYYMNGRFKMDVFTVVPFDLLAFLLLEESSLKYSVLGVLRLPKLLRFSQLLDILSDVSKALDDRNISLGPIRLLELLSGVILIAHWAGCGFYLFARWRNPDSDCEEFDDLDNRISTWGNEYAECLWIDTWVQRQIVNGKVPFDGGDMWQLYLRAFHWALPTLVVVVIGDVVPISSPETLYALIWMIVGVTINATIIGNVANIVVNLDTDSSEFTRKVDDIKHYMYRHRVKLRLQHQVHNYMKYLRVAHNGTVNESVFVSELPFTLQMSISDQTRMKYIKICPFFDFCSDEIVKALAMCLQPQVFSVGDILIQYGDMGQEMFFLEKGTVEVISEDGHTVLAHLSDDSFFGETALFFKNQRSTTIRAVSFCEVLRLDKWDLDNELRQREFDLSRMLSVFTSVAGSNARRNAAVKENLKLSTEPTHKLYKMIHIGEACDEYKAKLRPWLLPNSTFRFVWELCQFIFCLYYAFSVLYRLGFSFDDDGMIWVYVNSSVELFFMADIILCSEHFYFYEPNGNIVTDTQLIRIRYAKSWMMCDLVGSIPIDLLSIWMKQFDPKLLRLSHLFRVLHLPCYLAKVDQYLNIWNVRVSAGAMLLFQSFFYYMLVNHWCACMWFIIHRYFERESQFTWATTDCPGGEGLCLAQWNNELGEHNVCDKNNVVKCYIRAVYFVITTISTIGYGDISPVTELETIWEDVVVLLGACLFAGIIGAFAAYLSNNDTSGPNAFKAKMQRLQEYMKYRNLPESLQEEILIHHNYMWKRSQILEEANVMSVLPIPLQMELSYAVMHSIIRDIPILRERQKIIQARLAHAFTLQICPPRSTVYSVGDIGWDIYFIGSGLVKIDLPTDISTLDAAGKAAMESVKQKAVSLGTLYKRGNHFGESCLVVPSGVRQETVICKEFSELYRLTKEDFDYICCYMPHEDKEKFRQDILRKNGNTWHTFDDFFTEERYSDVISPTPPSPNTRLSMVKGVFRRSTKLSNDVDSRRKIKTEFSKRERVRLRSFSAEASKEAINMGVLLRKGSTFFRTRGSTSSSYLESLTPNMATVEEEVDSEKTPTKTIQRPTSNAASEIRRLVEIGEIDADSEAQTLFEHSTKSNTQRQPS